LWRIMSIHGSQRRCMKHLTEELGAEKYIWRVK
jgi:hypothetical protein